MYSFYVSVSCGLVDTHADRLTACCTLANPSSLVSGVLCTERKSSQGIWSSNDIVVVVNKKLLGQSIALNIGSSVKVNYK